MFQESNFKSYLTTNQFSNLDGLRGISIILVIWHHTKNTKITSLGYGFLGVDLFFVISGFLIVTLLLRERRRDGNISLKSFYIRRFLRIFPAFYGSLFFIYAFAMTFGSQKIASEISADFPKALFYVSNWFPMVSMLGITWSLSVEEQFYIVWPFLEKFARRFILLILGFLLIFFLGMQILHGNFNLLVNLPPFLAESSFTPILLGVCTAHLLDTENSYNFVFTVLNNTWTAIVCLFLMLLLAGLSIKDISGFPRFGFQFLFSVLLAACVVNENNKLGAVLRWKPLARIGVVSYGMYLLHLIALYAVSKIISKFTIDSMILSFLGTLLFTWLLAEISYRYYETPFLRLKKKWSR